MAHIQRDDLFDQIFFVIVKYFDVKIAYQVEVHLVTVIPYAHYEHTILIQGFYLFVEWKSSEFGPDHGRNLSNLSFTTTN